MYSDINIPFNCVLKGDNEDSSIINEYRYEYYKLDMQLVSNDNTMSISNLGEISSIHSGRFDITIDSILYKCCYIDSPGGLVPPNMLFITFNGSRRLDSPSPSFPRWGYYKLRNACFLGIDDPMYTQFPNLLLGWYYGTKEKCYIDPAIQIVNAVCSSKHIPLNNCVFFSSSGGGYASILAAIAAPNTLSISINPQLYINTYTYAKNFFSLTNIDLDSKDLLLRNNLAKKIATQSRSKHVIIVNVLSEYDYLSAVKFANEFGVYNIRYGLNQIKENILIWIYQAVPESNKTAHIAFETKQIYKLIEYISLEFKNNSKFDVNKYQDLAVLTNELWFASSKQKNQISSMQDYSFTFYENNSGICERLLSQFDNVYIQPNKSNYNFYDIPLKNLNTRYSITFSNLESNTNKFSYGIYNRQTKKFIKLVEDYIQNKEYVLNFQVECQKYTDISLLIYAGVFSKTKDCYLKIGSLKVMTS